MLEAALWMRKAVINFRGGRRARQLLIRDDLVNKCPNLSIPAKRLLSTGSSCHTATPTGPCGQIVYTWGPKYLYRDYFQAKVLFGYMDPEGT